MRATQGRAILKQDMLPLCPVSVLLEGIPKDRTEDYVSLMNTFSIAKAIMGGQDGFCATRT